jgi:hypothetical protein
LAYRGRWLLEHLQERINPACVDWMIKQLSEKELLEVQNPNATGLARAEAASFKGEKEHEEQHQEQQGRMRRGCAPKCKRGHDADGRNRPTRCGVKPLSIRCHAINFRPIQM